MNELDWQWMQRALELAERGRGFVEPNPMVGAVIVRDGQLIGEGWHQRYGEAHAEVNALLEAGESGQGATLYVTLEPCCHHGKTPPCTDAVIRAGVRRVVAAMEDPFPQVAGRGAELLRAAGVEIEFGLGEAEARFLNLPYLKKLATGKPYVHAKWAMTLDGKIATRTGDSKWISNETSRKQVHELRGRMDAIVVGVGTVLADDPMLTARPPGPRTAARIVLDSRGRTLPNSQLVRTASEYPTLLFGLNSTDESVWQPFRNAGCEVILVEEKNGHADVVAILNELGRRNMTNILIEGGGEILGSFLDADLADEFHIYIAPKIVGGNEARGPVGGMGVSAIAEALAMSRREIRELAGDVYVHGWKTTT